MRKGSPLRRSRTRDNASTEDAVPVRTVRCTNPRCDRQGKAVEVPAGVRVHEHVFVPHAVYHCATCGCAMPDAQ